MFFHKKSKNAAKMNKIVQKWQFWMTFYTTMKMELRLSPHGAKKWFHSYWFLIAQHINYPKIIMRAPVHFFWVVTTLGLQCTQSKKTMITASTLMGTNRISVLFDRCACLGVSKCGSEGRRAVELGEDRGVKLAGSRCSAVIGTVANTAMAGLA